MATRKQKRARKHRSGTIGVMARDSQKFVEKLRLAMDHRGLTASVLADSAGVAPNVIYNALNRGTVPRVMSAMRLASALNLPLEYLADDDIPARAETSGKFSMAYFSQLNYELASRCVAQVHDLRERFVPMVKAQDLPALAVDMWRFGLDDDPQTEFPNALKVMNTVLSILRDQAAAPRYTAEQVKVLTGQTFDPDEADRLAAELDALPGYSLVRAFFLSRSQMFVALRSGADDQAADLRALVGPKLAEAEALLAEIRGD